MYSTMCKFKLGNYNWFFKSVTQQMDIVCCSYKFNLVFPNLKGFVENENTMNPHFYSFYISLFFSLSTKHWILCLYYFRISNFLTIHFIAL